MEENNKISVENRINELRNIRAKNVRKLTKLLSNMVKIEWEIVSSAQKMDDNISRISAESLANASNAIQGAISHLISTKTDIKQNDKIKKNTTTDISSLKSTLKRSKLMS